MPNTHYFIALLCTKYNNNFFNRHTAIQHTNIEMLCFTCTNLKTANAGALSSRNINPTMLSSCVLKQLSPSPSRKLQNNANSLLIPG